MFHPLKGLVSFGMRGGFISVFVCASLIGLALVNLGKKSFNCCTLY